MEWKPCQKKEHVTMYDNSSVTVFIRNVIYTWFDENIALDKFSIKHM